MTQEDKSRGKAPSLRSRAVAVEGLVLAIADIFLTGDYLQLAPKDRAKLLANAAAVQRQLGLQDTGWFEGHQEVE